MKKFADHKAPLNMLKIRMQMKSEKDDSYARFAQELQGVCTEQGGFLEDLEWKVAVAEATDPTQVRVFSTKKKPLDP